MTEHVLDELDAYALLAVERMAAAGLGRDRFRFTLDRVTNPDGRDGWRACQDPGAPYTLGGMKAILGRRA